MKPPYWFCMGWWSPWCIADAALHWFHRTFREDRCGWACEKHDRALIRHWERDWDNAEPADLIGTPRVIIKED